MRGFTLIELILVLLVMGILLGSVTPAINGMKRDRDLRAGAQTASDAANYARSLAVTTGRRTRLGVDREAGEIKLLVEENPLTDPGNFEERSWPFGLNGRLPSTVSIEQVYYPVVRDEGEGMAEEEETPTVDVQTESEALEEREAVLLFDTDGSTRDTFIYLTPKGTDPPLEGPVEETEPRRDIVTVAIVGAIGATVIIPRYEDEIFEVYDPTDAMGQSSEPDAGPTGEGDSI